MSTDGEPGLRERKRVATRLAIQMAAIELVLEQGLGVTVEEISHRAGISPRTFFNYFPVKEDALLGGVPPVPAGDVRDRFVAAGPDSDVIDDLAEMFAEISGNELVGSEIYQLRRKMLAQHPELAARRLLTTRNMEFELLSIVEQRLVLDAEKLGTDPADARTRARLITFASFGVMRSAWMLWVDRDGTVPMSQCIRSAFADARALFGQK